MMNGLMEFMALLSDPEKLQGLVDQVKAPLIIMAEGIADLQRRVKELHEKADKQALRIEELFSEIMNVSDDNSVTQQLIKGSKNESSHSGSPSGSGDERIDGV